MSFRFGSFELDERSRELRGGGMRVRLQEQPFVVLSLLLERAGDVVTRDELRQRLWPDGTTVDFEHSLNAAVKRLRAVLGDDAEAPRFVETLPRRGYRFVARVQAVDATPVRPEPPPLPQTRLVVLPFSNLSDEAAHEYFSDGLTEELISQLGPALRGHVAVIARWSSMVFKGSLRGAREIGEALHAGYILEGSVRRDAQRVRIAVRLVDTASEAFLWSETYERTVSDWLSVQADVASRVARSLVKELILEPRAGTRDVPATAYQAYVKGRFHWARPADYGLDEALQYFEEAVRLAPQFAAAHGALARAKVATAESYRVVPRVALAVARDEAERALALDPALSEAHGVLADIRRYAHWDWDGADAGYVQAIACNPSNETAPRNYGLMLTALGRHAEGVDLLDRACNLDPLCFSANLAAAWVSFVAGDTDRAIARCHYMLDMDRQFVPTLRLLGAALLQAGNRDEAVAHLEHAAAVARSNPVNLLWLAHGRAATSRQNDAEALVAEARSLERERYVSPYHLAIAYAGLGHVDAAIAALEQACVDRDPMVGNLAIEPHFATLRGSAGFEALVDRLNIPLAPVG